MTFPSIHPFGDGLGANPSVSVEIGYSDAA